MKRHKYPKLHKKYKVGDYRLIRKFAWLPYQIGNTQIWLEKYYVLERLGYQYRTYVNAYGGGQIQEVTWLPFQVFLSIRDLKAWLTLKKIKEDNNMANWERLLKLKNLRKELT